MGMLCMGEGDYKNAETFFKNSIEKVRSDQPVQSRAFLLLVLILLLEQADQERTSHTRNILQPLCNISGRWKAIWPFTLTANSSSANSLRSQTTCIRRQSRISRTPTSSTTTSATCAMLPLLLTLAGRYRQMSKFDEAHKAFDLCLRLKPVTALPLGPGTPLSCPTAAGLRHCPQQPGPAVHSRGEVCGGQSRAADGVGD
eukprot:753632-Hanusia_phi.AAC.3